MNKLLKQSFACVFLSFIFNYSFAQARTVTGQVSDSLGNVLTGATVTVKNLKIFTSTNSNGKFTFYVPFNATTLVFSFTGMEPEEVIIPVNNIVMAHLNAAAGSFLNDVVVIGYGAIKRSNITSSISSITEKDIKNLPLSGADQMLQGKVAGVTVSTNTGQPGGGVSVRIRGVTTVSNLNGVNNEPLYVIDGIPVPATTSSTGQDQLGGVPGQTTQSVLATLNPSDIQSIDILKDASAQAIYGASGANGVILITTKKGSHSGEGKLNYDSYYGWQSIQNKLPLMNLQEYANYYNSVAGEGTVPGLDTIGEFKNTSILGPGTDWQNAVFQTGFMQNHNLSFSGGTNKNSYYLSGNYFDQDGTVIGSGFKRYAIRGSVDQQVKNWLRAGVSTNLSLSRQQITLTDGQQSVISLALYNSPATPVQSLDGLYIGSTPLGSVPFGNTQNPVALAMLRDVHSTQSRAYGAIYADIQLYKGLTLRNQFNYDYQSIENTAFQPSITNEETKQLIIGPNRLREDRDINLYYGLQTYLTYNKNFNKHSVNAVLGHEAAYSNYDAKYVSVTGTTNNMESIGSGTVDPSQTGGGSYPYASESYFARIIYTYDNKYSISASGRRDGSSSFGPGKRIGYFPAVSAGWTITNDEFAKNSNIINYLKIRLGAGSVGYSNTGGNNAYSTNIRLVPSLTGLFGQNTIPGFVANAGNPDLHWESVTTYNGGIDATLFNKRIDFTIDAYQKITSDMLLSTTLPAFAGLDINPNGSSGPLQGSYQNVDPPVVNAGKMKNTGVDISITSYNIISKNFTWNTNIIFSSYKNVLKELNSEQSALYGYSQTFTPSILTVTKTGQPVGQFYGFVTDGLYREQKDLDDAPVLVTGGPSVPNKSPTGTWFGDIRYKDLDENDTLDSRDQTFIGDPNPKFVYSITNTFSYKGFDLSIFLYGVYGNKIYNYTRMETEADFNVYQNQLKTVNDRYTANNISAPLPRYNQWNTNNLAISDRFVESGSYLRIQNISLGYNFPDKWISKLKITHARVYASGQNIYTFTKYSGLDPELGSYNGSVLLTNVDYGHYPNPRTITVGANIEF